MGQPPCAWGHPVEAEPGRMDDDWAIERLFHEPTLRWDKIPATALAGASNLSLAFVDRTHGRVLEVDPPDDRLRQVRFVQIRDANSMLDVPGKPGVYWIVTTEPVHHTLNPGTNLPRTWDDGHAVVYNGTADSLRTRARDHLSRTQRFGFKSHSGVSVDILCEGGCATQVESHVKVAFSTRRGRKLPRFPRLKGAEARTKDEFIYSMASLSDEEKAHVLWSETSYFRNGIDVEAPKHRPHSWRFYFIPLDSHVVRDFVEVTWRARHGLPALCSYVQGR